MLCACNLLFFIRNFLKNIKRNTIIILLQCDWREGIQWAGNQRILRRKRQLYGLFLSAVTGQLIEIHIEEIGHPMCLEI